ncbi:hypothetical protein F5Y19DRAFT_345343 [Xylariaceae sp. FL1651]|nr:hypothetical protein F5Y19DRAFT_345343 [Xylariaceae sp. FL1651]
MVSTNEKQLEESTNAHENEHEAPPSYEAMQPGSSASMTTDSKRPYAGPRDAAEARPTVDSPFNFPPAYTAESSHTTTASASASASTSAQGPSIPEKQQRSYSDLPEVATSSDLPEVVTPSDTDKIFSPSTSFSPSPSSASPILLAIPQVSSQPTSPFLPAYNTPILLRHGIPSATFSSFLATLSAFLSASVSERALAHAADVGRSLNDIPKRLGRDTAAHVKSVGRAVGDSAKKGNLVAAGVGVIAGAITVPVGAAVRVVDAALRQLPAAAAGGLARKPLSPRERADAYVAVAQRDWFAARRLTARLLDTRELLRIAAAGGRDAGMGVGVGMGSANDDAAAKRLVDLVHRTWGQGPEAQLQTLQREFGLAPLEITDPRAADKPLDIGAKTLWLVLTDAASDV